MKRQQPERREQAAIVDLLRTIDAAVYVLGTVRRKGDHPGTMQTPGLPDVMAFLSPEGPLVMIEVKSSKGRLSPAQAEFRDYCDLTGVPHVTGGLDDVIAFLRIGGWIK